MDNIRDWLPQLIAEIKVENGLAPDAPGMTCLRCRKMVNSENGFLFCECTDERKGIDPNDPFVIPITIEEDEDGGSVSFSQGNL
jgi:hypothetical protein